MRRRGPPRRRGDRADWSALQRELSRTERSVRRLGPVLDTLEERYSPAKNAPNVGAFSPRPETYTVQVCTWCHHRAAHHRRGDCDVEDPRTLTGRCTCKAAAVRDKNGSWVIVVRPKGQP